MGAQSTRWMSMLKGYRPEEARRLIEAAIRADPTPGRVCVTWILRQFREEFICLPQHAPKVRDLLTRWQQVKAARVFTGDRDINCHSYYGLRRLVEQALRTGSRRQREKQIKRQGVETVYEDSRYRILRVTRPDAAAAIARGTRWCTRDRERADDYLKAGPLHLFFRDGVRYAQLHLPAGELKDEGDSDIVPDAELAEILKRVFPLATVGDRVGLSLILGRPLVPLEQERALLRWWSEGYDPDGERALPIESASQYLKKHYAAGSAPRRRLAKLVREDLAECRLDVAWQLDDLGVLPIEEILRPLRRAIRRCYAARKFKPLDRLLCHFRGSNLMGTNLCYLRDELLDFLWGLLRLEPATRRALVSAPAANKDDEHLRRKFVPFYNELRQVRADRRAR